MKTETIVAPIVGRRYFSPGGQRLTVIAVANRLYGSRRGWHVEYVLAGAARARLMDLDTFNGWVQRAGNRREESKKT